MEWKRDWKKPALIAGAFLACFFLPVGHGRFDSAVGESLRLVRWYAREHVLLCLVPAFLIAGGIAVFVGQASVMKYLGARANKLLAYAVGSVSGSVLAVCSCTVLPLFAGIYRMGAGLGPATAFLYAGPAINVLAIILTARVLGLELGVARAVGAVGFSILLGLMMHLIFRKAEAAKAEAQMAAPEPAVVRPLWKNVIYFALMVGVLVFANWGRPSDVRVVLKGNPAAAGFVDGTFISQDDTNVVLRLEDGSNEVIARADIARIAPSPEAGLYGSIYRLRFYVAAALVAGLLVVLWLWFRRAELAEWAGSTWSFAVQILPLLLIGVLLAGLFLGDPGHGGEGLIPRVWVASAVGGNSLGANLLASVAGALMYFATLTEVPILHGLMGAGMGKGPALALLLAGPALSLPNMLVIRSVMGTKKTLVYVALVVIAATISGVIFGSLFG